MARTSLTGCYRLGMGSQVVAGAFQQFAPLAASWRRLSERLQELVKEATASHATGIQAGIHLGHVASPPQVHQTAGLLYIIASILGFIPRGHQRMQVPYVVFLMTRVSWSAAFSI